MAQSILNLSTLRPTTPRAQLELARRLAWALDSAFQIPLINRRVGLDAILGLMPIAGDLIALAISLYIVYLAREMGMSRWSLAFMLVNVVLDTLVGSVPVLGDAADMFWQANLKNVKMMERFIARHEQQQSSRSSHSLHPGDQVIEIVPEAPQTDKA